MGPLANWRKLDLRDLRRKKWTMQQLRNSSSSSSNSNSSNRSIVDTMSASISYQHCAFSDICFNHASRRTYWTAIPSLCHILQNVIQWQQFILMLFLLLMFWNCCMVQFIFLKPLKFNFLQFLEEAWTGHFVECKVPRELLLHIDQLMPPL